MTSFYHTFSSKILQLILALVLLFLYPACGSQGPADATPTQRPYVIKNVKYYPIPSSTGYVDTGIASWYGRDFHGRTTSNGERYNMYAQTAAHKILPINTMLLVKNLDNGRQTVVRINDRGPFVRGRILDLSYSSAKKLGIIRKGTGRVRITALAAARNSPKAQKSHFNTGQFYVQVGAFLHHENALRLQRRFTATGHNAVIQKLTRPNRIFYRVQVYTGTRLHMARRAEKALLAKGYGGAFIVAR
ncbi:MAG: septal ring lytic transglycosylase RlpA family protein [Desulfopila sp.]